MLNEVLKKIANIYGFVGKEAEDVAEDLFSVIIEEMSLRMNEKEIMDDSKLLHGEGKFDLENGMQVIDSLKNRPEFSEIFSQSLSAVLDDWRKEIEQDFSEEKKNLVKEQVEELIKEIDKK
ncbi:hypothetical protein HYV44_00105 [Candidatus Microgenomates bacterium]|nr:hypothetical protein [Candidatus Microgenomates bacterium]